MPHVQERYKGRYQKVRDQVLDAVLTRLGLDDAWDAYEFAWRRKGKDPQAGKVECSNYVNGDASLHPWVAELATCDIPCDHEGCTNSLPKEHCSIKRQGRGLTPLHFCSPACMQAALGIEVKERPSSQSHTTTTVPPPPVLERFFHTLKGDPVDVPTTMDAMPTADGKRGWLPVTLIEYDQDNPRSWVDQGELGHLAASMATEGQIHDLIVEPVFDETGTLTHYVSPSGYRRLLVHKRHQDANQLAIRVTVRRFGDDTERDIVRLQANQHERMPDRDLARFLKRIKEDRGITTAAELARLVHMNQILVGQLLAIAELPEAVLEHMDPSKPRREQLSRAGAFALAKADLATAGTRASIARALAEHMKRREKAVTAPEQVRFIERKAAKLNQERDTGKKRTPETVYKAVRDIAAKLANRRGVLGADPRNLDLEGIMAAARDAGSGRAEELVEDVAVAIDRLTKLLEGLRLQPLTDVEDLARRCPEGHVLCSYKSGPTTSYYQYVTIESYWELRRQRVLLWQINRVARPWYEPKE